ncbi:MAG: ABC transporter ATP-binding protein [Corynebacterium sp.]|nr:ABC transporter ATP-binding protein [Corynebacterium sp.]
MAVRDVSLTVEPGQIHALLGPNGAGKTTTVRMCAGLLTPTAGTVHVAGINVATHPARARTQMGLVLGGELGFYPRATAKDNLLFFADVQGLSSRERKPAVAAALARVQLADAADKKVSEFSRGMVQRLHLARATLAQPALLLLDEPTIGMDPDIALQVRDLIREFAADGTGVLLTSHSMSEVEELADVISVIGAGRIAVCGQVSDIAAYAGVQATTSFTVPAQAGDLVAGLGAALTGQAVVSRRPAGARWSVAVYWRDTPDVPALLTHLPGVEPPDLITRPASLEEVYLALADRLAR